MASPAVSYGWEIYTQSSPICEEHKTTGCRHIAPCPLHSSNTPGTPARWFCTHCTEEETEVLRKKKKTTSSEKPDSRTQPPGDRDQQPALWCKASKPSLKFKRFHEASSQICSSVTHLWTKADPVNVAQVLPGCCFHPSGQILTSPHPKALQ